MICPYCHQLLPEESISCPYCSNPIVPSGQTTPKKSSKKIPIIIISVVLAVVILGFAVVSVIAGAIFIFTRLRSKSTILYNPPSSSYAQDEEHELGDPKPPEEYPFEEPTIVESMVEEPTIVESTGEEEVVETSVYEDSNPAPSSTWTPAEQEEKIQQIRQWYQDIVSDPNLEAVTYTTAATVYSRNKEVLAINEYRQLDDNPDPATATVHFYYHNEEPFFVYITYKNWQYEEVRLYYDAGNLIRWQIDQNDPNDNIPNAEWQGYYAQGVNALEALP